VKNSSFAIAVLMGLLLFTAIVLENQQHKFALAQTSETIIIKDDGSVEGTNKVQRNNDVYTFTGNISGKIQVKKSNLVIDGAGFTLDGNKGTGIAISNDPTEHPHPSEFDIWNVTVKNLRITNFKWGIDCEFGGNHTFYGNYISNDYVNQDRTGNFSWDNLGILLWGSSGNNITRCTVGGSPAIYMHFAVSNNFVVENNIVFGADLRISGIETFDANYWSDYSLRYPNASAIGPSGVWNTPYVFADTSGFENRKFQDSHPLVNPLDIPNFSSALPTVQSIQEPFDILILFLAVSIIVAVIAMGLYAFFNIIKHKPELSSQQNSDCTISLNLKKDLKKQFLRVFSLKEIDGFGEKKSYFSNFSDPSIIASAVSIWDF
jgi:hypothetical protein